VNARKPIPALCPGWEKQNLSLLRRPLVIVEEKAAQRAALAVGAVWVEAVLAFLAGPVACLERNDAAEVGLYESQTEVSTSATKQSNQSAFVPAT
jgi:hypothetical protein